MTNSETWIKSPSETIYDPTKLTECTHDADGVCRYRNDTNVIYLADVIIVDK
jgi:hypothetical protein